MGSTKEFSDLGRRAQSAAYKRIGLLEALLERLAERPLAAIPVRELCEALSISEQTFFNTFRGKPGLLVLFVNLWSVEMQWRMQQVASGELALRVLFEASAEQMLRARWLMPEIIVHQIYASAGTLALESADPTLADKLLRYPEMPGVEALEPLPVERLVSAALEQAIEQGELPATVDVQLATRLACALFFGAPASMADPAEVAQLLRRGIASLWRALAEASPSASEGGS